MLWLFNIHIFRQLLKCMFDLFKGVVSPFNYTTLVVSGKDRIPQTGLTKPVEWPVTPTNRPKLVRNRCVIEDSGCVFVL